MPRSDERGEALFPQAAQVDLPQMQAGPLSAGQRAETESVASLLL
jgi:hypothetical protein